MFYYKGQRGIFNDQKMLKKLLNVSNTYSFKGNSRRFKLDKIEIFLLKLLGFILLLFLWGGSNQKGATRGGEFDYSYKDMPVNNLHSIALI